LLALGGYVLSVVPWLSPHLGPAALWDVGVNSTVFAASALLCLTRAARDAGQRLAWACIGTGLGAYAAGTLLFYGVFARRYPIPYPSPSDALWLLLYAFSFVGVGLLVMARMAGSSRSMWLDGLVSGL